ncbi:MAG: hypothetical protein ACPGVK_08015 [Halocynthiibacter sp.]
MKHSAPQSHIHKTQVRHSWPYRFMASFAGEIVTHGWMERPALWLLEHWFFPVSRLWAAAGVARGEMDAYFDELLIKLGGEKEAKLKDLFSEYETRRLQVDTTEESWDKAFFQDTDVNASMLKKIDDLRLKHRSDFNAMRQKFGFLRKHIKTSVHHNFSTPAEVAEIYPHTDTELRALFAPPKKMPKIEASKPLPRARSQVRWLRFKSPADRFDDMVYARVLEPVGIENPPTLIFGHGIGVDFDHWDAMVDFVETLPDWGIRVIRPEAAFHGRRVKEGYYAGEAFLSSTPLSFIDFFVAQHQEWAVLSRWARETSTGPLAIGGSSLGAQSAQIYSINANAWDAADRPDAMLLLTHCEKTSEVALDGALADIWGLHEPMVEMGWTHGQIKDWITKVDPDGVPAIAPEHIVSVLGNCDRITPFKSGKKVQKLWNLPQENTFVWPCGHFGVPLRMVRHPDPIERLCAIFKEIDEKRQDGEKTP